MSTPRYDPFPVSGPGIRGLSMYAKKTYYVLKEMPDKSLVVDFDLLREISEKHLKDEVFGSTLSPEEAYTQNPIPLLEQLKKLGASCDWDRTKFTMDEPLSEAVIDVFIDLYNKFPLFFFPSLYGMWIVSLIYFLPLPNPFK
mgnify:CR=1 FL=1